jgi:DNA methyltransferase 1-associated protein 1
MTPFTNPSRTDGLVLKHWKMTSDTVADDIKKKGPLERPEPAAEEEYPFKKYNVKVTVPEYTVEQYEEHLKSESWTKEETDYLMGLCLDYDLRWILITDRYEYQSSSIPATDAEGDTALIPAPQIRTMEDLKARYYTVAAKCLAISRPPANMTTAEFELYEKMRKFDPVRESTRKTIADSLMRRTIEEVNEEKFLLSELKRIVESEELLLSERRELYARLDAPQSSGNVSQYHNSAGISQLMQTLLNADKNKKRRSLLPGEGGGMSSPATAHPNAHLPNRGDHDGGPSMKQKQPSISHPPATKRLSPADEAKYGVSHPHDRLTSGVQFRSDRAIKFTQAKSQAQTQKLQAALTELGLPPRLTMPTDKVVAMFERLIGSLHLLLEVRKVSERVESEAKVIENMIREREKKARRDAGIEEEEETVEGEGAGEDVVMGNEGEESVDQGNENEESGEIDGDVKMEDGDRENEEEVEGVEGEDGENEEGDVEAEEDESRIQGNVVAEEGDEVENEEGDGDENENENDDDAEVEVDIDAEDDEDDAEEEADQDNDSGAELEEQENDPEADDDAGSPEVQLDEEEEEEDQESGEDQDNENENEVENQGSEAGIDEELDELGEQDQEQESGNSEAEDQDQDQDQEDGEEAEAEADDQAEEEEHEPALDPDKGPLAAATRQYKRSVSVMSGASRGSGRSVKRGRK